MGPILSGSTGAKLLEPEAAMCEWENKMLQLEQQQQQPPPLPSTPAPAPAATETNARCDPDVRATLRANDPANQWPSTDTQIPLKRPPPSSGHEMPKGFFTKLHHPSLDQCSQLWMAACPTNDWRKVSECQCNFFQLEAKKTPECQCKVFCNMLVSGKVLSVALWWQSVRANSQEQFFAFFPGL